MMAHLWVEALVPDSTVPRPMGLLGVVKAVGSAPA
jgi:hypothetical protein